jgi:hypothetical protein
MCLEHTTRFFVALAEAIQLVAVDQIRNVAVSVHTVWCVACVMYIYI